MNLFLIALAAAVLCSAIGFKYYIWFISIGYGLSIAGIGIVFLIAAFNGTGGAAAGAGLFAVCAMLVVYGLRLAGYLAVREFRSTYNQKMQGEIKDGKLIPMPAKIAMWITVALLYACQTAPAGFRIANGKGTDAFVMIGLLLMICGVILEAAADLQKAEAKKKDPGRFVDTGLYRFVRCPNYLGELILWTGVFITGIGSNTGAVQWLISLAGYIGIIYVMFSGARRLEMRQNRTYGDNEEYQVYVRCVPIMIPFIPLYSVEKHKWLVA